MGQHFLSSRAVVTRLIDLFAPVAGEHVLEIGPGRGALTDPLLEAGVRLTAIEMDPDLASRLASRHAGNDRLRLVQADVLTCDLTELAAPETRVIANLPYSITGEVLHRLLLAGPPISSMLLMLQREVVNRIVAAPGGRVYGSLSVLSQYFTRPASVMNLAPGSFSPPPAVSSSVVSMPFRPAPREIARDGEAAYARFIRELFAHRRQTLLNNLKAARPGRAPELTALLAGLEIDPRRRPETLSREEALSLHRALV